MIVEKGWLGEICPNLLVTKKTSIISTVYFIWIENIISKSHPSQLFSTLVNSTLAWFY